MSTFAPVVAAYHQTLTAHQQLARSISDDQWGAATECPQWSIGDVMAHVIELERWVAAGAQPFTGTFQAFIDASVERWRGRPRREAAACLDDVVAQRQEQLATLQPTDVTWSPLHTHEVTYAQMAPIRVFDLWTHEQDVRRAAGIPGGLGSAAARVTHAAIVRSLPRTVVKGGGAPAGATVRLTALGQVPTDVAVHVDADGRGSLVPTSQHRATAHATMAWESFARLATGRGDLSAHRVWLGGDRALAEQVVRNLNMAP